MSGWGCPLCNPSWGRGRVPSFLAESPEMVTRRSVLCVSRARESALVHSKVTQTVIQQFALCVSSAGVQSQGKSLRS